MLAGTSQPGNMLRQLAGLNSEEGMLAGISHNLFHGASAHEAKKFAVNYLELN